MPRDERPKRLRATRRTFLRACAIGGAAGLPALACSGPQDLPLGQPAPLAAAPASAAPPPRADAAAAPSPSLAALRDFAIADGLEPATVFLAAAGDR